jgi:CRP-like cAMP-binding protein
MSTDGLIAKLDRLAPLSAEDVTRLRDLTIRTERFARYRSLIREGERPDHCCLLVDGFAARSKQTLKGSRQIVSFHLPGDLLDIQHLLLSRADHSVETITSATIGWIPKAELLRLAWERPTIGQALWKDCLIDASIFREWVLNVGRRDAKARIAHMLCEFVARCRASGLGDENTFELPMTQSLIADATGLTAVHVNRSLRLLDADGVIARTRNQFRIVDWNGLREIADFDPAYLHAAA